VANLLTENERLSKRVQALQDQFEKAQAERNSQGYFTGIFSGS